LFRIYLILCGLDLILCPTYLILCYIYLILCGLYLILCLICLILCDLCLILYPMYLFCGINLCGIFHDVVSIYTIQRRMMRKFINDEMEWIWKEAAVAS
jgi:hypothetical protein